jgi:hypothetical protein
MLGLVWLHVQATLLGYKAAAAREAGDKLRARNAYLRLALEKMQSPAELEREAKRRIGMQRPDPRQMIVLEAEPTPAARAQHGPVQLASALAKRFSPL